MYSPYAYELYKIHNQEEIERAERERLASSVRRSRPRSQPGRALGWERFRRARRVQRSGAAAVARGVQGG